MISLQFLLLPQYVMYSPHKWLTYVNVGCMQLFIFIERNKLWAPDCISYHNYISCSYHLNCSNSDEVDLISFLSFLCYLCKDAHCQSLLHVLKLGGGVQMDHCNGSIVKTQYLIKYLRKSLAYKQCHGCFKMAITAVSAIRCETMLHSPCTKCKYLGQLGTHQRPGLVLCNLEQLQLKLPQSKMILQNDSVSTCT